MRYRVLTALAALSVVAACESLKPGFDRVPREDSGSERIDASVTDTGTGPGTDTGVMDVARDVPTEVTLDSGTDGGAVEEPRVDSGASMDVPPDVVGPDTAITDDRGDDDAADAGVTDAAEAGDVAADATSDRGS